MESGDDDDCGSCTSNLNRGKENVVNCSGTCKNSYHLKCANVSKRCFDALQVNKSLKWFCEDCLMNFNLIMNFHEEFNKLKDFVSAELNNFRTALNRDGKANCETNKSYSKVVAEESSGVVVIKPKKKQESKKTKEEIQSILQPSNLEVAIEQVRGIREGGVMIKCKTKMEHERIKKAAEAKLDNYRVSVPELKNPCIKVVDIEEKCDAQELLDWIRGQNSCIIHESMSLKVRVIKKMKRNNMAILECDPTTFRNIMREEHLYINWSRCRVFEYVSVNRCFKCGGFSHHADKCTRGEKCLKCSKTGHKSSDCEINEFTCINCSEANNGSGMDFDVSHSVFDFKCPIYLKRVEFERRKIRYSMWPLPEEIDTVNNKFRPLKINVLHQNVQCIRNKIEALELLLDDNDIDIVCITEHWLKTFEVNAVVINNYSVSSIFCRSEFKNGGVAILHRTSNLENMSVKELSFVSKYSVEKTIEIVGAEVKIANTRIIVLTIYRSPEGNLDEFFFRLDNVLDKIVSFNVSIVLCGDINIDYLTDSQSKKCLTDLFTIYGVHMMISDATRISNSTKTCLDYVCASSILRNRSQCSIVNGGISDHLAQILQYFTDSQNTVSYCYRRIYNEKNYSNFFKCLGGESWMSVYEALTVDEGFTNFINILKFYHDLAFPIVKIKTSSSGGNKKWITKGIRISSQKLKWLYQQSLISGKESDKLYYRKYKTVYNNLLVAAKRLYNDQTYSDSINKSKAAWSIINDNVNNSQKKNNIRELKIGDQLIEDKTQIADYLNLFFRNLENNTTVNSYANSGEIKQTSVYSTMFLESTTEAEIFNIIMSLKNSWSSGIDNISSNLLKHSCEYIIPPLTSLVNSSIRNGIFPSALKLAKVIPLHKGGDTKNAGNYRPIALLSTIAKVLERVIFDRIYKFAVHNDIFADSQHGFRRGRSVTTAIYDYVTELHNNLNNAKKCVGIFMDLSKAFDMVDHQLLLDKLYRYGLRGKIHNWIQSYLSDRSQLVEFDGVRSATLTLSKGVPQGSVLGPLLFLFFINEIPEISKNFTIMFADDISLLCPRSTLSLSLDSAQESLDSCCNYFCKNNLLLNTSKTVFMNFTPRISVYYESFLLKVQNRSIAQVPHTKFLGLHLDSSLNWKVHIDNLTSRLSSSCYALYRLSRVANRSTVMSYYYANFYSRATYGLIFWGASPCAVRVFVMQKRAVRYIAGLKCGDSCRDAFITFNIMTLPCLYIFYILCFVRENLHTFPKNNFSHSYNTRNGNDLLCPNHMLSIFEQSPAYMGVKLYNGLPSYIKQIESIKEYKKKLKLFLLTRSFYSIDEFLLCV